MFTSPYKAGLLSMGSIFYYNIAIVNKVVVNTI